MFAGENFAVRLRSIIRTTYCTRVVCASRTSRFITFIVHRCTSTVQASYLWPDQRLTWSQVKELFSA